MRTRVIAAVVALLLLPLAAVGELPKDVQQQLAMKGAASLALISCSSTRAGR